MHRASQGRSSRSLRPCTTHPLTKTHFEPTRIDPDTYLVHDHHGEGTAPVSVALNTMVIRAAEPVVVDTGMMENHAPVPRGDVFSLVDPVDIRWVFISHDDVDHTGNLNALIYASAPNATLVIDWFMAERMGASLNVRAQPLAVGAGRRHHRRRRPHPARRAPAGVRLADDTGAVRPADPRLLGLRLLRDAHGRTDPRRRRSGPRRSGWRASTCSPAT